MISKEMEFQPEHKSHEESNWVGLTFVYQLLDVIITASPRYILHKKVINTWWNWQ